MSHTDLIAALEAESAALEEVLFKLKEQHFVLTSGEHRWLPRCTTEVEAALAGLQEVSGRREAAAAAVHAEVGLPPQASLSALADRTGDEVLCQQLHQWRRRLRDQLDQVRRCSRNNRQLLAQGLAAATDALSLLGSVPTYDSAGSVIGASSGACVFDSRI